MNNYLYPFFWQHGEPETVICDYMDKIHACGMGAVCIEARPHPEFVSDGWWRDMEIIIRKAKEHDMQLWILDDSHFPTGYANGRIEKDFPQYKKLYLYNRRFDVVGPMRGARINAGTLMGRPWDKPGLGDKEIIGVYLAKRSSQYTEKGAYRDAVDAASITELKEAFEDNLITLDIPEGSWSVFVVFTTREGGEDATKEYLNPLVAEASQILIDEVYQPHYDHFRDEFGKTIQAFFSDEPRFGNKKGPCAKIGSDMVLPWRPGLEKELPFEAKYLPLLWHNAGGKEYEIRYQYMDLITKLYSENFTAVLAGWCHEHGVNYLGHHIEDEGAHCRLGYGPGHFFRAQQAQDYAGVDVIGTQIVPGMPYHHDAFSTGGNNGEFYHYALGKLAGSAAHLEPAKKGRAMCEAFGAYGWNEGLKMMKWLTDHLITRGINTIVPHAFNPGKFPDWDCPPHFYAHGNNPQFRYFGIYTSYANRMLGLFQGGKSMAKAGVLYPAKLEWYGKCMPLEKVLRELTEHQIDADIISDDYLERAETRDKKYIINGQEFEILFIPEAERIPEDLSEHLLILKNNGIKVMQIGRDLELCEISAACEPIREVKMDGIFKELVYYHYRKDGEDIFMFFNESVTTSVDTMVSLPVKNGQRAYRYDAFKDRYAAVDLAGRRIKLALSPYESAVIILTEKEVTYSVSEPECEQEIKRLNAKWEIGFSDPHHYPEFEKVAVASEIKPLNEFQGYGNKSGTASYKTVFTKPDGVSRLAIDLGTAYETVEVFVNGKSAGIKICPPYKYEITALVQDGENRLRIEATNTIGAGVRDGMSQYLVIEPFGMMNQPVLYGI